MRYILIIIFLFFYGKSYSQLGFCSGSKGDPIFHEDFGPGSGTGNALAPGITSYKFVNRDPQDGEYTIAGDIGTEIDSWHSMLPNTNISGGRALIVNADFNPGRFYKKEIAGLCENTTYEFSAFLMNVYDRSSNICENGGIPNNVKFEIWDETDSFLIKSGDTPDIISTTTPQWQQFALTFRSEPGQGSVILKMFNNGEGGCGNDLAIDDIVFRSCGDLTTISTDGELGVEYKLCKEDTPVRLTLEAFADNSVYAQQFYQWQISLNGEDWGDIPGANSVNYETSLIEESVFYRVKVAEDANNLSSNECSSASEAFFVEIIPQPKPPVSNGDVSTCENEAAPALRVTVENGELVNWYDEETGGNLLAENTNTFFPVNAGTFYAETVNPDYNCKSPNRTAVKLSIERLPVLEDEELKICPESHLILSTGVSGYDYLWSGGEITESVEITSPGNYSVIVRTGNGCEAIKNFMVTPVETAEIREVKSVDEDVTIFPAVEGDFFYSLDGDAYQGSPRFNSVEGGVYTAYMKDSEDCRIDTLRFAHIVVPRMISPNGDGFNDTFQLRGVEFFANSQIQIYDRYGKLLKIDSGAGFKWNGTLNSKNLPADDYWYRIIITGFKDKTGHFTLKR